MNIPNSEQIGPRLHGHVSHGRSRSQPRIAGRGITRRQHLVKLLIFTLAFLSPWDNLLVTLQQGRSTAISSGILLSFALVLFSIPEVLTALKRSVLARVILSFPFIFVPGAFLSVSAAKVELGAMIQFILQWLGYSLVSLAVAGWYFRADDLGRPLFKALVMSSLLLTSVSFLDYYGVVSLPYINEIGHSSALVTYRGVNYAMLGGFETRTQAAVVFEGIAAFLLGCGVAAGSRWYRLLSFGTVTMIIVFMLHTGNRSFVVSIAAAVVALLYFGRGLSRFRWLVYVVAVLLVLLIAGYYLFPGQAAFYQERLQSMFLERDLSESDLLRVVLLDKAVGTLLEGHIFGNGPQGIPVLGASVSTRDPHSIFTFLLWSAGIPGVIWFLSFISLVARTMMMKSYEATKMMLPFFLAILASYVGGIAHSSLGNLMLWIFTGLFIGSNLRARALTRLTVRVPT